MKRNLLFFILQLAVCVAFAQTSVETALDLTIGSNTQTFESAETQNTAYFKYTTPADQDQLITVRKSGDAYVSFQCTTDGTYSTNITGISLSDYSGYTYPVAKNTTVYIAAAVYGSEVAFTASVENANVSGGNSYEDAIVATDTKVFVPSKYNQASYELKPTYLVYTPDIDGILSITSASSMSNVTIQEGTDGTPSTISTQYNSNSEYEGKYGVAAGKTYYILFNTYSPLFCTFKTTEAVTGASCDMPYEGSATGNVLPAAAGTYWYSFTVDHTVFLGIDTEATLTSGAVKVFRTCSDYSPAASVTGSFDLRYQATAGTYLISIEKANATEADETFYFTQTELAEGDSFDNPLTIETGDHNVPAADGTYYYKITVPEEGQYILNVTCDQTFYNYNTRMALYSTSSSYTSLASGTNSLRYTVSPNTSYILAWTLAEGTNGFTYHVALDEVQPGDLATNPITAMSGSNNLAAGSKKYYSYTATTTGWLNIDTDLAISVTFPRGTESYYGYYPVTKDVTVSKIEVVAGNTYLICFENIAEDTTFELYEEEYKEGESKGMALEITDGASSVSTTILNSWYTYTATADGMLEISSDINYEYASDYSGHSDVYVYTSSENYAHSIAQSSSEGTTFKGTYPVKTGDQIWINVVTYTAQEGKTIVLSLRDYVPGETADNPLELTAGENTLAAASRSMPVWYSITCEAGELSITGSQYFRGDLYAADNTTTAVAYSNTNYDYDTSTYTYSITYNVPTAGTYLFRVTDNYGETPVTVSATGITTGISTTAQAGEAEISLQNGRIHVAGAAGTAVIVYDMSGRAVAKSACGDATGLALPAGTYIVKAGKQTRKISVR